MTDKILKIAKRLKTFTLEDIVMFTGLEINAVRNFLDQSDNIQKFKNKFKYVEIIQKEETFKIIDKNILSQNSDITLIDAINLFMEIKNCKLSSWSKKTYKSFINSTYKSFINSQILPFFRKYKLKDITIQDIEQFKLSMDENGITERRIKNVLTLLNQIIKHFQKEGIIDKTCCFEVKRVKNISKREVQILSNKQLKQLFQILSNKQLKQLFQVLEKRYPYLLPLVEKMIITKQPLNSILTGDENKKEILKRRIRKDFYKVKQQLGLENYIINDLRFCQKCVNKL